SHLLNRSTHGENRTLTLIQPYQQTNENGGGMRKERHVIASFLPLHAPIVDLKYDRNRLRKTSLTKLGISSRSSSGYDVAYIRTSSTRRFLPRPSSVELSADGYAWPGPFAVS